MNSSPETFPPRAHRLLELASPWLIFAALAVGGVLYSFIARALDDFDPNAFGLGFNTSFLHDPLPYPGETTSPRGYIGRGSKIIDIMRHSTVV